MRGGWLTIARWHGAPIRLHWSIALSVLLFGGFRFAPAFWAAFVLLILVHELGHAALVKLHRLELLELAVHGLGGYCRHAPARTREQVAVIAWGGVLAQAAAFATAGLAVALLGPPATLASAQFHDAFTTTNLWMMLINLIPVEPLDGAKAWPLFGMLYRRFRARSSERRAPRFEPGAQSRDPREEARKLVRDLLEQSTKSKPDA